jgi:hypothetical protein
MYNFAFLMYKIGKLKDVSVFSESVIMKEF